MNGAQRLLEHARRLIEAGWTKGAFARDADGLAVKTVSKAATCFCSGGAMDRAVIDLRPSVDDEVAAHNALRRAIGLEGLYSWNDDQESVEPVIAAFRAAWAEAA